MSNKAQNERDAGEWLEHFIMKDLPTQEDINYNSLVKKLVLAYGVTTWWVDKWIKRFYMDEGVVIIENGIIKCNIIEHKGVDKLGSS